MTRRKRTSPPLLVLTRDPGWGRIVGRDADGEAWTGIGAQESNFTCARCGEWFPYGYAPMTFSGLRLHCVKCVEFRDMEQESGR